MGDRPKCPDRPARNGKVGNRLNAIELKYPSFVTLRTVKSFAIIISVIQKAIANDFTVSFNFQP